MVELRQAAAAFVRELAERRSESGEGWSKVAGPAITAALTTLRESSGWRYMTAELKRAVLSLNDAVSKPMAPSTDELNRLIRDCTDKVSAQLGSLADVLDAHDRETWAECSARLSQVELHLSLGSSGGPRIFSEAMEVADGLSGRDPGLDNWLKMARLINVAEHSEAELREDLERFKEQLRVLPFH
jgi:hypothetical protein